MQNPTHFIEVKNPSWNTTGSVCQMSNVRPIDIFDRSLILTRKVNEFFNNNGVSVTVAVFKIRMK